MQELARELRDRAVWVLARLSLAMLLAMMAALFVGSAAQGSSVELPKSEPAHQGMLDQVHPLGIVLVGLIVVGGFGILLVGAFRPQRLGDQRDMAELLRD